MQALNKMSVNRQKGLSLIEMIIVIVLIGILAAIVFKLFNQGVIGSAKGQQYQSTAQKLTNSWSMYVLDTGVDPAGGDGISGVCTGGANSIMTSGNSISDLLVNGPTNVSGIVSTSYAAQADNVSVDPLGSIVQTQTAPSAGSPGAYAVEGHVMTFCADAAGNTYTQYANVPTATVQSLWESVNKGQTFTAGTSWKTGPIEYVPPASGTGLDLIIKNHI